MPHCGIRRLKRRVFPLICPVKERHDLGAGAGIAGQKLCAAALHDALAQCPIHGGHRITGYGGGVRKAGDQVCQRHSVHPAGYRIAE